MRRTPLTVLFALTLTILPLVTGAWATDIKVTYRVDSKQLKADAPAGTVLSAQLFTDSACTTMVASSSVNVENVSLIEQLKAVKVKQGPAVPKAADIQLTMTGVPAATVLYAKVTGTGIVPVGGACQLQSASVNGAPRPGIGVLRDANGTLVGTTWVFDLYSATLTGILQASGHAGLGNLVGTQLYGGVGPGIYFNASCPVFYLLSGCAGQAYITRGSFSLYEDCLAIGPGNTVYAPTGPFSSTAYASSQVCGTGSCNPCVDTPGTTDLAPAAVGLTLTPPFHIAVE